MAKIKTTETDNSVRAFIESIKDEAKRKDCRAITKLMAAATGAKPKMWGTSIVGFGKRHYQYADGKPGEICKVGKHKYSGGCLHITRVADVDVDVLKKLVAGAYQK